MPTLLDLCCDIVSHRQCGNHLYVLTLAPRQPVIFLPGQFVMIAMPDDRFLFRRPFSVMQQSPATGHFDVLYKQVGLGTRLMVSQWSIGDVCQVLAPLGLPFPPIDKRTLLIGGGIGIAPVFFAGINQPETQCVYGVRREAELGILPELEATFGQHDRLHIATDDGSTGFHGHVGQLLAANPALMDWAEAAFICGPTPMMRAVSQQLLKAQPDMAVYVSMEERMPCGIGACTGCVVPRTPDINGHLRLPVKSCVEGPVMLATDVDWDGSTWNPALPAPFSGDSEGSAACQR